MYDEWMAVFILKYLLARTESRSYVLLSVNSISSKQRLGYIEQRAETVFYDQWMAVFIFNLVTIG